MPGIDPTFICRRLSIYPRSKLVAQKKRKLGGEKRKAVVEETWKLNKANFIREIDYTTWLANMVMVKKANGKWRMCTDYTDLNKACLKDSYPLPSIDRLIDGASGHGFLSFLDAYSRYNQIRMYPQDEEKIAFMSNNANYCYRVMPFGLKNAGATYQRLMHKVFLEQIGRNMEVYMDDMVVKSSNLEKHLDNLREVLGQVKKFNMRLNPEKCSFGVQGGKFLGFMLTCRGIEASPEKCRPILEMQSPTNIKEVQRLAGRIAALQRFLPKSAERDQSFFKLLKNPSNF